MYFPDVFVMKRVRGGHEEYCEQCQECGFAYRVVSVHMVSHNGYDEAFHFLIIFLTVVFPSTMALHIYVPVGKVARER